MAVRAMSRGRGEPRARPRDHATERNTGAPPRTATPRWGPARCNAGLARDNTAAVERGTTRTSRHNGRPGAGRRRRARQQRRRAVPNRDPGGPPAATRTCHGRARHVPSKGAPRARPQTAQPRGTTGAPPRTATPRWGPPLGKGGLARQPTSAGSGARRARPGTPRGRRPGGAAARGSGGAARSPSDVRVAHGQPPGRAMAVRAMSRARGRAALAPPAPCTKQQPTPYYTCKTSPAGQPRGYKGSLRPPFF